MSAQSTAAALVFAGAHRQRWADIEEDDEVLVFDKPAKSSSSDAGSRRWADIEESDGDESLVFYSSQAESTVSSRRSTEDSFDTDAEVTKMLCDIPCKFSYTDVVEAIDSQGFAGKYEYVYLPHRNGKVFRNVGYAFVKFPRSEDAAEFASALHGFRFPGTTSEKSCTVKEAHTQGLKAARIQKLSGGRPAPKGKRGNAPPKA